MLNPQNITSGEEQYEYFTRRSTKRGERGKMRTYCQYDYRNADGRLFSCVAADLDTCRERRDAWLAANQE